MPSGVSQVHVPNRSAGVEQMMNARVHARVPRALRSQPTLPGRVQLRQTGRLRTLESDEVGLRPLQQLQVLRADVLTVGAAPPEHVVDQREEANTVLVDAPEHVLLAPRVERGENPLDVLELGHRLSFFCLGSSRSIRIRRRFPAVMMLTMMVSQIQSVSVITSRHLRFSLAGRG